MRRRMERKATTLVTAVNLLKKSIWLLLWSASQRYMYRGDYVGRNSLWKAKEKVLP